MDAVLLHCLNHCNKAADAIKKGNEQLKGAPKGSADAPRDQGFTRPKVGMLRNAAPHVVCRALLALTARGGCHIVLTLQL